MRRTGLAVGLAALMLAPALRASAQGPDAESLFNSGLAHLREGRTDLAVEQFKKAVKQDSKNPYFHKGLGVAYFRLNKLKEAEVELRKALELNRYYVDVRNDLGSVLLAQGKREEGKREFKTAFDDPTNPTPELTASNLGFAYFQEKDYGQALNWYQTSLARNKGYPRAYLGISDCLVALGRLDEASAHLEAALKQRGLAGDPEILVSSCEVHFKAGRFSDARGRCEQAARLDPTGEWGKRARELLKGIQN